MNPKVTVVVSAYNSERWILQVFNSLVNQTFVDWECIVVDDVSTDETLKILKEYAACEPRVKYKTLEKNSGSGKIPMDTAIAMANSKWIIPVGHDDTLAPNAIEKLVSRQAETGADMVLLRMVLTDESGNVRLGESVPSDEFDFSTILTGLDAAKLTIGKWVIGMNGGLYSKRLFDKRHLIKNYMPADEYDSRQLLIMADKVAFVDVYYYYRQHSASISKSFSIKLFDYLYTDKLLQELIEKNYDKNDDVVREVRLYRFHNILYYRLLFLRSSGKLLKDERLKISSLIEENYKDIKKEYRESRSKSCIKNFFIGHNYTLFKLTTYIYSKLKK